MTAPRPVTLLVRAVMVAGVAGMLAPGSVHAQGAGPEPATTSAAVTRPGSRPPVGFRAYFVAESAALAAADTFDAVLGKSRLSMTGGGGEVLNIWKGLFARVSFSSAESTGSRVVVFDDEVVPLGIPLTVQMRPFEVGGGWRMSPLAAGRVAPYVGGGILRMGYRETSEFGTREDNTAASFSGGFVFGGVDVTIVRWIFAGAEVEYRTVPDALGNGGASAVFGETDLGGVAVRMLVGIRR